MLLKPQQLQIISALADQEKEKTEGLEGLNELFPPEEGIDQHGYQLKIKRRQIAGMLQEALRNAGYKDLANTARFRRVAEEQK